MKSFLAGAASCPVVSWERSPLCLPGPGSQAARGCAEAGPLRSHGSIQTREKTNANSYYNNSIDTVL